MSIVYTRQYTQLGKRVWKDARADGVTPLPLIAATSYLGDTKEKRKLRLSYHLKQREVWNDLLRERLGLYDGVVEYPFTSLCSGYTKKELSILEGQIAKEGHGNNVLFRWKKPKKKWEKQNWLLRQLYKTPFPRAVLLLDDDIIPRPLTHTDREEGLLVDTFTQVLHYLKHPDQMGGPIMYFSCAGLRFDAYWKSAKYIVGPAPPTVVSWAMLIRNDLNVLYTRDLVEDEKTGLHDDLPFRIKCWAENKPVLKHNRAFFKSFQPVSKTVDHSSWFASQEERVKTNEVIKKKMQRMFPGFFQRGKNRTPEYGKKGFGFA